MLRKLQVLALGFGFAAGAVATVGCEGAKDKTTGPVVSNNEKMKEAMKKTGEAVKDAADKGKEVAGKAGEKIVEGAEKAKDVAGDLVTKAKENFLKPIQEMLSGTVEPKIKKLEEEEKTVTGDAKKVASDKITKAKELMGKVKEKIAALTAASGDKWEAVKDELTKLTTELKTHLGL